MEVMGRFDQTGRPSAAEPKPKRTKRIEEEDENEDEEEFWRRTRKL